jgi:phosphinothricin acetyltransferase
MGEGMSPTLRPVAEADLPLITATYAREVLERAATFELEAPDAAEFASRIEAVRQYGLPWLVAEIDGRFAGYAYLSPFRLRPAYRYCAELSVYVAEDAQRRGVGSALMEALIAAARREGLRHLIGAIGDSANQGSIALHRRAGFREVGTYRQVGWKFDRWIDVVLMQLDLDPKGGPPAGDGLPL